jgi:pimeloyl-ACP methyl ester carboxylesterase
MGRDLDVDRGVMGDDMPRLEGVTHRWVDLPGMRMHLAEAGAGDTVLLLHGWPQHWWEWREVIGPLARTHRVIAPDLRGAGWTTPAPGPQEVSPEQLVEDVLALLDALELESVDLVAHDYSVLTAIRLCFDHPARVRRLLCLGPHPYARFHPAMLATLPPLWFMPIVATPGLGRRALARDWLPRHILTSTSPPDRRIAADDLRVFIDRLHAADHAAFGSALYRSVILPEGRRLIAGAYRGRRLTVPTVALLGALEPGYTRERLAPQDGVADDLSLELVPGARHFLADERPDAVVDHALRLFAR